MSIDEKAIEDSIRQMEAERSQRIAKFSDAVAADDSNRNAWYELGIAYAAGYQHDLALSAYRRVGELNPGHWEVWLNIGHVHARQDEDSDATAAFRRAVEGAPDFATASAHLGDHGQSGKAAKAFSEAARQLGLR